MWFKSYVSLLFNGIVATWIEGVTAQQPAKRHATSSKGAISTNRLSGILRTCWKESARRWKKRRNDEFIESKKCYQ